MSDNPLEGIFGQMETSIGTEAYQANVDLTKSHAEANRAQAAFFAKRNEMRQQMMALLAGVLIVLAPVYAMFLVWLFKQWVI